MSITDMECRNAKPQSKLYHLTDGDGLYLQINPKGSKYWRFKFSLHGRQRILALGVYPTVTLLEARERRDKAKREVEQGNDPVLLQTTRKQLAKFNAEQSFEKVALEWHERNKYKWIEKHAVTILFRFENYLFPKLGRYAVNAITAQQLLACLQKVENTSPDTARRLLQYCSHVFKYAVLTGRMSHDFSDVLKQVMKRPTKNHYNCIDLEELPELLRAIDSNSGRASRQVILALRLMMLTFLRTRELLQAHWTEIDFDNAMWIIPGFRMKRKLQHLVPLSHQALAILKELKDMNGHRLYIFPSKPNPRKPMSNMAILTCLKRMGYKHKMTGHGFRTLATGVGTEKLGYKYEVIDRQLSHVSQSDVRRAYDRAKHLPERRQFMQALADYFDKALLKQHNERTKNETQPNYTVKSYLGNITTHVKYQPLNPMPAS